MKLLRLSLCNLNSLRNEVVIDFTEPMFTETGLFLITGETGAGKSTLLDAITLALYGKTSREHEKEVCSHGSTESQATVEYESVNGKFRAKWMATLTPKGERRIHRSVEQWEDNRWVNLASKSREVDKQVTESVGLNDQQFLKSVMLAQNKFSQFLTAAASERSGLLEQLTDSEIYSKISKAAFEKHKKERQELATLEERKRMLNLLSETEIAQLDSTEKANMVEIKKLEETVAQLEKHLDWQNKLSEQHANRLTIEERDQEIEKRESEAKDSINRLEKHDALAPLGSTIESYRMRKIQQQQHSSSLATQQIREAALAPKISLNETRYASLVAKHDTLHNSVAVWKERVGKQAQYLNELDRITQEVNTLELECAQWANKKAVLANEIEKTTGEVCEMEDSRDKLIAWMEQPSNQAIQLVDSISLATMKQRLNQCLTAVTYQFELIKNRKEIIKGVKLDIDKVKNGILENEARRADLSESQIQFCDAHHYSVNNALYHLEYRAAGISAQDAESGGRLREFQGSIQGLQAAAGSISQGLQEAAQITQAAVKQLKKIQGENNEPAPTLSETLKSLEKVEETQNQLVRQTGTMANQLVDLQRQMESAEELPSTDEQDNAKKQLEHYTQLLAELEFCEQSGRALEAEKAKLIGNLEESERQLYALGLEAASASTKLADAEKDFTDMKVAIEFPDGLLGLAEQIEHLEGLVKTMEDYKQSGESLKLKIEYSINELIGKRSFSKEMDAMLDQATQKRIKAVENQQAVWEKMQQEIGTDNPQAELEKKENEWKAAKAEKESLEAEKVNLAAELAEIQGRLVQLRGDLDDVEEHLLALNTDLGMAAKKFGYVAVEPMIQAYLSAGEALELRNIKQEIEKAKQENTTLRKRNEEMMKILLAEPQPDLPGDLQEMLAHSRLRRATLQESLGAIREKKRNDESQRAAAADLQRKIKEQQVVVGRWERLDSLIGSADGKKFRTFAQSVTLDQLLRLSNLHLATLQSGRYRLKRGREEMEIVVVDQFQADAERSVKTLSGGESFLSSLALALGLASMAGSRASVNTLFIDEGFGSLDDQAIELALNALEAIQASGKMIGIVTHVQAMKDRLGTQIFVEKMPGGISRVRLDAGL
jgi:exonuclease SbcC